MSLDLPIQSIGRLTGESFFLDQENFARLILYDSDYLHRDMTPELWYILCQVCSMWRLTLNARYREVNPALVCRVLFQNLAASHATLETQITAQLAVVENVDCWLSTTGFRTIGHYVCIRSNFDSVEFRLRYYNVSGRPHPVELFHIRARCILDGTDTVIVGSSTGRSVVYLQRANFLQWVYRRIDRVIRMNGAGDAAPVRLQRQTSSMRTFIENAHAVEAESAEERINAAAAAP